MKTVTMFFQYEHPIDKNSFVLYMPDNTYPEVPDDVAAAIADKGLGEIVPDEILGTEPDEATEIAVKNPRRRKVSRKWQ